MSWNYRVLAHKNGESFYFKIHEVYYDKNSLPNAMTERAISVGGETLHDVLWVLSEMKKALEKPVLSFDDFPNEFKG